jgi:hypothetical protein
LEYYCLLGCDAVKSGRYLPASWRNTLYPSSGSKSIQKNVTLPHSGLEESLLFDPEDGGITFFRNASKIPADIISRKKVIFITAGEQNFMD